eukprot:CCRYP_008555-RA/>CCRYP_008555-RA protein AED:0.35 eAED:0.42 QI:0/0/0/1/0/0/3/0/277
MCLDEMWNDAIVCHNGRMARLLQGDIGSATVLEYLLGLSCIELRQGSGPVVAILAPSQLLAEQQYQTLSDFANTFNKQNVDAKINNIGVEILTGTMVGYKRNEVLSRLEHAGKADAIFLVMTHVLVLILSRIFVIFLFINLMVLYCVLLMKSKGLVCANIKLWLVVPLIHYLLTPFPLAAGLQEAGLLDVTYLEYEPRTVKNTITTSDNLEEVVSALRTKIDNHGSKCFWVLPRIGETRTCEDSDSFQSTVLGRYKMLTELLGPKRVGFIHGRRKIQ